MTLFPRILLTSLSISCLIAAGTLRASDEKEAFSHDDAAQSMREPNILWPQATSFLLPGFDQFLEGENSAGLTYSGIAIGSMVFAADQSDRAKLRLTEQEIDDEEELGPAGRDKNIRPKMFGLQMYQEMGGLSAYHSFRTAVSHRRKLGQFEFLQKQDSIKNVLTAPFHFAYLKRPSTFIPLALGVALNTLILTSINSDFGLNRLQPADYAFSGLFSYNAGTHEEAVFRGWLMPVMRHYSGSDFWSNILGSAVFAAAHMNTVSVPIPQLLLGYHLGNVTIDNGWSISESVFIHTWWDVLAFLAMYQTVGRDEDAAAVRIPMLLPPLEWRF